MDREFFDQQGHFMDQSAFVGFIAVAVVLAILYVLPFIFSKKLRPGWLIFALVIFILDTLFMLIDVVSSPTCSSITCSIYGSL